MGAINRLSAIAVAKLSTGKYCDGACLRLHKLPGGSGQWVLRVTIHGKRREMGLGSFPIVSLKAAREEAEKWRALARTNTDPIKKRDRQKREAARNLHLLKDIALDAFESRKAELKGDGENGRWYSPLELHVLPKLGKLPVADINQNDIRDTLAPIWHSKAPTAEKALGRLAICMRHAAALGLEVDLQATEKARALLGKQRHKVQHIPAMPWQDVPAFYASLKDGSVTHLAMRLLILTSVRSSPLRFIHENQIDGELWTISGEAMKVIDEARRHARDGFL